MWILRREWAMGNGELAMGTYQGLMPDMFFPRLTTPYSPLTIDH